MSIAPRALMLSSGAAATTPPPEEETAGAVTPEARRSFASQGSAFQSYPDTLYFFSKYNVYVRFRDILRRYASSKARGGRRRLNPSDTMCGAASWCCAASSPRPRSPRYARWTVYADRVRSYARYSRYDPPCNKTIRLSDRGPGRLSCPSQVTQLVALRSRFSNIFANMLLAGTHCVRPQVKPEFEPNCTPTSMA
jgi:hypothetical protein